MIFGLVSKKDHEASMGELRKSLEAKIAESARAIRAVQPISYVVGDGIIKLEDLVRKIVDVAVGEITSDVQNLLDVKDLAKSVRRDLDYSEIYSKLSEIIAGHILTEDGLKRVIEQVASELVEGDHLDTWSIESDLTDALAGRAEITFRK